MRCSVHVALQSGHSWNFTPYWNTFHCLCLWGRKYKHWSSLINKLWFVIGANCLKCKLDANWGPGMWVLWWPQAKGPLWSTSIRLIIKSASGSEGLEIPGHLSQVSTWCTYLVDMTCCGIWSLDRCMKTFSHYLYNIGNVLFQEIQAM